MVGIGNDAPLDLLDVLGNVRVGTGSTGCVRDRDATVIAGTCSSDARLKKNIQPFPNVLGKVAQLRPVHFNWRAEEFPERHFGTSRSFGLIAQEVEQILPELVTEDEEGFKAVNYSKLPLLLLQAVREMKAKREALAKTIGEQQDQIQEQNEQIEQQRGQLQQLVSLVEMLQAAVEDLNARLPVEMSRASERVER